MDLIKLRTFVAVAEKRNLTRAAKQMNISQPAVTAHIKALEEQFGIILFKRSKKGMTLTAQGESLIGEACSILESSKALSSHAMRLANKIIGNLKIGINLDSEILRITQLFKKIKLDYPKITLQVLSCSSRKLEKELLSGNIDCGYLLGGTTASNIITCHLERIYYVIVGPAAWKERIEVAEAEQIAKLPWVVHTKGCRLDLLIERIFGISNKNLVRAVEADDKTMTDLILAGAGVGLMHKEQAEIAEKQGEIVIWRRKDLFLDLSFAYCISRKNDPLIGAILKVHDEIW